MLESVRQLRRLRDDPLDYVLGMQATYGDVFMLTVPPGLGPRHFVWATGPDSVRDTLTNAEVFVKRSPVYREMADALGDGLLTSEGDTWKAQRRTLQPLFTRKRVQDYGDAFVAAARSVGDAWSDGARIDLDVHMQTLSLRSVSVTLFGMDATDEVEPIVAATGFLSEEVVARGLAPIRLPRWLPTRLHRKLDAAEEELARRVDAIVDRGRARDEERDDLVSLLLRVKDPETGEGLSDVEIREQALVLLLAGYDTTSTALTFALHLLGRHPEVQDRARDEVRSVLGDRDPTAADVGALTYVRQVLDEAMRLYPSAYITSRLAVEDTSVGGFDVPRGSVAATSFYALHRNPRIWDNPAGFDPSRFDPEQVRERDPYAYLPFGGGPRSCIGNHFALLEATLAIAVLLQRWRFDAQVTEVPLRLGITLRPAALVLTQVTKA